MKDSPIILDGKALANQIEEDLRIRVEKIKSQKGVTPGLAAILVGNDSSSEVYIKMKRNACKRIGMDSEIIYLPETTSTEELLNLIDNLNNRKYIFGILLQHPVPNHINERYCFDKISLEKDVDGVTCYGFGRMSMKEPAYGSATATGIMRLIEHYKLPVESKNAVVVGCSPILGKPIAMMLLNAEATVTICHYKTKNLEDIVKTADIVVGALGVPQFIKADWIKEDAIIIDAGYHKGGIGDIEIDKAKNKAFAYTPVPGGVGPMTVATLLSQTVLSAERYFKSFRA